VHVLVFNSRGQVFLQKRSLAKDKSPGLWDSSASGHVDTGEQYDACALRELREELGLAPPQPLERLFKLAACEATDQEHVWIYRCEAEGPFTLHPQEIERGEWVAPEEVSRRIAGESGNFSSAFIDLWTRGRFCPPR
jgi:isopentenyldiphosphate isomerase